MGLSEYSLVNGIPDKIRCFLQFQLIDDTGPMMLDGPDADVQEAGDVMV